MRRSQHVRRNPPPYPSPHDEPLRLRVAARPPATEITITIEGDFRVGGHRVMPTIIE